MRRKIISFVIMTVFIITNLFSIAGCSNKKDDIIKVLEDYGNAICELSTNKISNVSSTDISDEDIEYFNELACLSESENNSSNHSIVLRTILNTLSYKINEKSLLIKNSHEATCSMTFYMVDYDTLYEEDSELESYLEILQNSEERIEYKLDLTLSKEKDEWKIDNAIEISIDLLSRISFDYDFPVSLVSYPFCLEWFSNDTWNEDDDAVYYTPASFINLYLSIYDESVPEDATSYIYFKVSLDDEVIYTSPRGEMDAYFYASYIGKETLDPGRYSIYFYDGYDNLLGYNSCVVEDCEELPTIDEIDASWYEEDSSYEDGVLVAIYEDASRINLYWSNCPYSSQVYYKVFYETEEVFVSETGITDAYYGENEGATLVDGLLPSGIYIIEFYSSIDDSIIFNGTAYVNMGEDAPEDFGIPPYDTEVSPPPMNMDLARLLTRFYDESFDMNVNSLSFINPEYFNQTYIVFDYGVTQIGLELEYSQPEGIGELYYQIQFISLEDMQNEVDIDIQDDDDLDEFYFSIIETYGIITSGSSECEDGIYRFTTEESDSALDVGYYFITVSSSPDFYRDSILFVTNIFVTN